MIAAYNLRLGLRAAASAVLSLFSFALAFLFFEFASRFIFERFAKAWVPYAPGVALAALALIALAGYLRWQNGKDYYGYGDSGMFLNLDSETAGAFMAERAVHRVTGPAYLLGQIFLAGPLQLFKAASSLRGMIPPDFRLEARLKGLLAEIESKKKWEDIAVYGGRERELETLVAMGLVDYSRTRGKIRAKD